MLQTLIRIFLNKILLYCYTAVLVGGCFLLEPHMVLCFGISSHGALETLCWGSNLGCLKTFWNCTVSWPSHHILPQTFHLNLYISSFMFIRSLHLLDHLTFANGVFSFLLSSPLFLFVLQISAIIWYLFFSFDLFHMK